MPLPSRSPTRQRTGAGPRPAPPAGARRPGAGGAGRRGVRTEVGEREAGPARLPEGARGGVVRRKDARARRRRGGGGDPGRTLTHRLVLLLARAPRQSALGFHSARLFPSLNVQPGRSELRRSRRERRACGSGAEGVGKMGRLFSPPPRPPQTQPPPAPLGHGNCGPAHHARLRPSTPPAGGVTAALANQRSRGGRARRA